MGSASLGSPQTFNLYAYCANDPVNHIDPDGLGLISFLKKVLRVFNKIIKWLVVAIVVAAGLAFTFGLLGIPGAAFLWSVAGQLFSVFKLISSLIGTVLAKAAGAFKGIFGFGGFALAAEGGKNSHWKLGAVALLGLQWLGGRGQRRRGQDKEKRPPKERVLIVVGEKAPRDWYKDCVWREWNIFNQDVEKVTAAADKHFEERTGPRLLDRIQRILELITTFGGEVDPGDGESLRDLMNKQARETEIEKGTQDAAKARDERIQQNCKKP